MAQTLDNDMISEGTGAKMTAQLRRDSMAVSINGAGSLWLLQVSCPLIHHTRQEGIQNSASGRTAPPESFQQRDCSQRWSFYMLLFFPNLTRSICVTGLYQSLRCSTLEGWNRGDLSCSMWKGERLYVEEHTQHPPQLSVSWPRT